MTLHTGSQYCNMSLLKLFITETLIFCPTFLFACSGAYTHAGVLCGSLKFRFRLRIVIWQIAIIPLKSKPVMLCYVICLHTPNKGEHRPWSSIKVIFYPCEWPDDIGMFVWVMVDLGFSFPLFCWVIQWLPAHCRCILSFTTCYTVFELGLHNILNIYRYHDVHWPAGLLLFALQIQKKQKPYMKKVQVIIL